MPDTADVPSGEPQRKRPMGWIVTAALLAAVAVGLGVWAFSAQSDADDAQTKLEAQQQAATASDPAEADAEADAETQQRYEDVKEQLGITGENLDQVNEQLDELLANAEQAEQARTEAVGALDRASAEVEAFKSRAAVAQTCLSGTFDALDAAFAAGGLEAAVTELEDLAGGCRSAGSP